MNDLNRPLPACVDPTTLPMPYVCSQCGAEGVKLWRQYQTFLDNITLLCRSCSEVDQACTLKDMDPKRRGGVDIGWRVPAIPTDDGTFWGFGSVPQPGWTWWHDLPETNGSASTSDDIYDGVLTGGDSVLPDDLCEAVLTGGDSVPSDDVDA